jgi:hypothetical protein
VWHLWHDGSAYVLGGGPEQQLPVSARRRRGGGRAQQGRQSGVVVRWPAEVTAVEPGSERWTEVLPLLAAERLNAPAGAAELWAEQCRVLRLTPRT